MKKTPLSIRIKDSDKAAWLIEASKQGLSLTSFIELACNAFIDAPSVESRLNAIEKFIGLER